MPKLSFPTPKKRIRAVAYARYSSDQQREESIDAQLRAIREYAKKNNNIIINEYIDRAKSGTNDRRPAFQQMILDSKSREFTQVLVHKLDRFARDRYCSADSKQKLKMNGVLVYSVTEQLSNNPEDILMESMLEGMAEYYSKNLARETMKGLKENAINGRHTGGIPPLGYNLDKDSKELIINKTEAEAVSLIFNKYNEGYGYGKIINELNCLGYKTKRGNCFGKNSLHDILTNIKYSGTLVFNKCESKRLDNTFNRHKYKPKDEWIIVKNRIPAIVSKELFESVQLRMKENQRTKSRHTAKEIYLLSCKIRCGICNAKYTGINRPPRNGFPKYVSYRCSKHNGGIKCNNPEIRREALELLVLDKLSTYLFSEQNLEKFLSDYKKYAYVHRNSAKEHLLILKPQHEKIKQDIETVLDLMIQSKSISFDNKLTQLEEQKSIIEKRIYEYNQQIKHRIIMPQTFKNAFHEAKRRLSKGELSSTRMLIGKFIKQIIVYPDKIIIEFSLAFDNNMSIIKTQQDFINNSEIPTVSQKVCIKKNDIINGGE